MDVNLYYPRAKGSTTHSCGLKPVLKNERDKSFIVDPKVFIVWSLCNGKNTLDEIQVKYNNKLGLDGASNTDANVGEIITTLERIGLVET